MRRLLHYRLILLHYRAVITLPGDYYIIGCNTLNSATYETVNGSGGDFGMTIIDLVSGQCMKRTNISKRCSDVEFGSA